MGMPSLASRSKVLSLLLFVAWAASAQNAPYIDPFLGVEGGGNVFPGAALPFGMVKAGPDVGSNSRNAGWMAEVDINGFSQTHVSGTGGGAKYGNTLVQPTAGGIMASAYGSPRGNENAAAGFYGVTLTRYAIKVEVTASQRVA